MSRKPSLAEQRRQLRETRASRAKPRPEQHCRCGAVIPGSDMPGRGRPKKWCSDACRRAAHTDRVTAGRDAIAFLADVPMPLSTPIRVEVPVPRELTETELMDRVLDDPRMMRTLVRVLIAQAMTKQLDQRVRGACVELAEYMQPPPRKVTTAELLARVENDPAAMMMLAGVFIHQATHKTLDRDLYLACLELARIMLPYAGEVTATEAEWEAWSQPGRQLMDDLRARFVAGVVVHP